MKLSNPKRFTVTTNDQGDTIVKINKTVTTTNAHVKQIKYHKKDEESN
jgi:hypothetical protein